MKLISIFIFLMILKYKINQSNYLNILYYNLNLDIYIYRYVFNLFKISYNMFK